MFAATVLVALGFGQLALLSTPTTPGSPNAQRIAQSSEATDAVPDAEAAIRRAKAVLALRLGRAAVERQEPYSARLEGDVWIVVGDPHLPPNTSGGGLRVDISKRTGEILRIGSEA
jgi:hypothetical protein